MQIKFMLYFLLLVTISCKKNNDLLLPFEYDDSVYLSDANGKRVSDIYDEMYLNYKGGAILTKNYRVLVFDNGIHYEIDLVESSKMGSIEGAILLSNGFVVIYYESGVKVIKKDSNSVLFQDLIVPIELDGEMLAKANNKWKLIDAELNVIRDIPDENYASLSGGGWASFIKNEKWYYFNIYDDVLIGDNLIFASLVVNGFCMVSRNPNIFSPATINSEGLSIMNKEYSSGGSWISSDGEFSLVREINGNNFGIINSDGKYKVYPDFTDWYVFDGSTIFLRSREDDYWKIFKSGKISETKIEKNTSIRSIGINNFYLYESDEYVGYSSSYREINEIFSVRKKRNK